MRKSWFGLLLFISASCHSQSGQSNSVSADEFEKEMKKPGVQILDVRTAGEFSSGHIKNSLQADWTNQEQFFDRVKYVDKDKPVLIYCLVGGRSAAAATWMRNNGYKDVVELQDGINAWKYANKPLVGFSNEKQISLEDYLVSIPKDKITLVDVGADWCPPCVKMEPVLNDLKKNKDLNFYFMKIDAGVQTNLLKSLQIEPIPVFIIYKNGKETWRKSGLVAKEEFIQQLQ